jgi:glycopeptide antibiotics resistance protein
MWDIIYRFTTWASRLHDSILGINDAGGWYLDDKQLHFLVFGVLGMLLIFVLYPIFKFLASRNHTMVITWLYVFTVIMVLAFAVEIGQWYTGTGRMESSDIAYGICGFLVMFLVFALLRGLYHAIHSMVTRDNRKTKVYSKDDFYK